LAFSNSMGDNTVDRLLVFRVAEQDYAADASVVREILPAQNATRIPGATESVRGLINVRGRLITLVDGRKALSHPPDGGDGPIVILDVGDRAVGFAVDAVLDFCSVSTGDLTERGELPGIDPRLVRAVGCRADVSFVLLDVEALLSPIMAA